MAKYELWVATNLVGSRCEEVFDIRDEDIPVDKFDADFEEYMLDCLLDSGLFEWGYKRIDE